MNRLAYVGKKIVKSFSGFILTPSIFKEYDLSRVNHTYLYVKELKTRFNEALAYQVFKHVQKKYFNCTDPFISDTPQARRYLKNFNKEKYLEIGIPDLFFEADGKLVFIEAKLNRDGLSASQINWFAKFSKDKNIDCYIVKIISLEAARRKI